MYDKIKAYYIETSEDNMLKWRSFSFLGDGFHMYTNSALPKTLLKAYHNRAYDEDDSRGYYDTYKIYVATIHFDEANIFDTNNAKHIEKFAEDSNVFLDNVKNGGYPFETVFDLLYFLIECYKQLNETEAVLFTFFESNRIFNCIKHKIPYHIYDVLYKQEQLCLTNASSIIYKRKISYEVII